MNQAHVNEAEATLQLVQMISLFARSKSSISPVSIRSVDNAKALLGIQSRQTKDKKIYWLIPDNIGQFLSRAGFDPTTGLCSDIHKFELALLELEQARTTKFQDKCISQDLQARQNAIRLAMQRFRPAKPPNSAPPSQFIEAHLLNSKIANHLNSSRT